MRLRTAAVGRRADAATTGARPRASVASPAGVGRGKIAERDCPEGGQQLREPGGQTDYPGPDIVRAILDETLAPNLTLFDLPVDPPGLWEEQQGRVYSTRLEPIARIEHNSLDRPE
jgi:hypothetical protein